jgi:hypothetical protein
MPTGYTHKIKDGITFNQFAMSCARAMGALVMMRDEPSDAPIPEAFEPSTFHKDKLMQLRDQLGNLRSMSVAEIEKSATADHAKKVAEHAEREKDRADLRAKYVAMLEKVQSWTSPTPAHDGFKSFMNEQITNSIDWDCDGKYDTAPTEVEPAQWIEHQLARTLHEIEYHTKANLEEIERTVARNAWLKALRDSLGETA